MRNFAFSCIFLSLRQKLRTNSAKATRTHFTSLQRHSMPICVAVTSTSRPNINEKAGNSLCGALSQNLRVATHKTQEITTQSVFEALCRHKQGFMSHITSYLLVFCVLTHVSYRRINNSRCHPKRHQNANNEKLELSQTKRSPYTSLCSALPA